MEKLFLDTNPFIYFLTNEKNKADAVERILTDKNKELYTSYEVLNEIKFILLINKAMKSLKTNKRYKLIKHIKNNKPLRKDILTKYAHFYVNIKSRLTILGNNEATELLSNTVAINYGLLPTDASLVAHMLQHNIKNIVTNDTDFEKISNINIINL